jgi:uncharacterized membrane protein YidH (DUF202 family)
MRASAKDIISGAVLLLFAVGVFIYALQIPVIVPIDIGSGFFPKVVAVLLGIVSLPILVGGLRRYVKEKDAMRTGQYVNAFGVTASIASMVVYIVLLDYFGFFIASVLYLFAQFSILALNDRKTMIRIGILSLSVPIVVYMVFVYGFDMILPEFSLF